MVVNGPTGTMRVSGEEQMLVGAGGDVVKTCRFVPGISGMPQLDAYAKIFDRYRVEAITLSWVPSVGTNTGGDNVIGVDLDPRTLPAKRSGVLACVPKLMGPAWQAKTLSLPRQQLMSRRALYTYHESEKERAWEDSAAFAVAQVSSATVSPGMLMVKYVVHFEGPFSGE